MVFPNRSKLLSIFDDIYPEPKSELNYHTPYELLVSVILSAQCTDKKVNETTPVLFKKYPTIVSLSKAKVKDVETVIRPINYYKTKAKHLILMANQICENFHGEVPKTHQELTSLSGVGRKTANVILCELKITPAIPVDTHVFRVSKRIGIAEGKDPNSVEKDLERNFQSKDWYNLHHWLIFHGRRVCKAQRPLCESCAVNKLCEYYKYAAGFSSRS